MLFDTEVVEHQIASAGLLETTKIRSLGYPYHMAFADFLDRSVQKSGHASIAANLIEVFHGCCHNYDLTFSNAILFLEITYVSILHERCAVSDVTGVYQPVVCFRYEYLYRLEAPDDSTAEEFSAQVLKEEFEAQAPDDYQMGLSELFLREVFYQHLEQQRVNV